MKLHKIKPDDIIFLSSVAGECRLTTHCKIFDEEPSILARLDTIYKGKFLTICQEMMPEYSLNPVDYLDMLLDGFLRWHKFESDIGIDLQKQYMAIPETTCLTCH